MSALVLVGSAPDLDPAKKEALARALGLAAFDVDRAFLQPHLCRVLQGAQTVDDAEAAAQRVRSAGISALAVEREKLAQFCASGLVVEGVRAEDGQIFVTAEGGEAPLDPASLLGLWLGKQERVTGSYATEHVRWQASPGAMAAGFGAATRGAVTEDHEHTDREYFLVAALQGPRPFLIVRSSKIALAGEEALTQFDQFVRVVQGLKALRPDLELDRTLEHVPEFPGLALLAGAGERALPTEVAAMLQALQRRYPFPASPTAALAPGQVAPAPEMQRVETYLHGSRCTKCENDLSRDGAHYRVDRRPWCRPCAEAEWPQFLTAAGQARTTLQLAASVAVSVAVMLVVVYWVNMYMAMAPALFMLAAVYWFGFAIEKDRNRVEIVEGGQVRPVPSLLARLARARPGLVYGAAAVVAAGVVAVVVLGGDGDGVHKIRLRKTWEGPDGVRITYKSALRGMSDQDLDGTRFGDALDQAGLRDESMQVPGTLTFEVVNAGRTEEAWITTPERAQVRDDIGVTWTVVEAEDDETPSWVKIKVLAIGPPPPPPKPRTLGSGDPYVETGAGFDEYDEYDEYDDYED